MSLKKVYKYIYNNELLENCAETDFVIYLAAMQSFIEDIPDIKCSLNNIINKIKKDISRYNGDELTWLYFEEIDGYYLPINYALADHDILEEKDHIETTLVHVLKIFKLINL